MIVGGAWWVLKPKSKDNFDAREISIKQADIPTTEKVLYEDEAGFWFEYADVLEVKELELENIKVYSSLELTNAKGERLTLRIADTNYEDIEAWQKNFEKDNVISQIDKVLWVDIEALQFYHGAPKSLKTIAIENGVVYELENLSDSGGFWDRTHKDIMLSFEFDESVEVEPEPINEAEELQEKVVLLEEVLE